NAGIEYFSGKQSAECGWQIEACHTERSEVSIKETIENRFFANAQNDNNDKVDSASLHSALCNPLSATDSVSPLSADCPPHTDDIDYLIFLDSDDFWELNCVEECVKRMDGVDILWFDSKTFLDGVKKSDYKSIMKWLHYTHEQVISREEWARRLEWSGICWWAWAVQGMIDFSYLKKIGLEFINGIAQEDDAFGIYLFSQANYIYVLPRELYQYRIRANSTMNYGGKVSLSSINVFFRPYLKDFKGDLVALKAYWHQSSFVKTTLAIIELLENLKDEHTKAVIKDCLMHNYTNLALGILKSPSDPLGLVDEVAKFKDYVKEDKKPHGAVEMVKNSIKYKIGFYILKARGVKEILALPGRIKGFINTEKKATKLYKERLKKYPFAKKPSLKEYADYNEALKYTEHLSYKLGDIAYRNYKWWFCGAFLLLPFELLWAGVRFNTRGLKRSRTLMLDRLNAIQSQVSRIAWNPPQVVEKIEGFGESAQERNMFYKLADSKGALCVTNYTNDAWIKRVLHCGGCVELVEENHLRFKEFKLKYKECDNVRLRYGSFRENPRVRLGDTSGLGILPPLFWDINALPLPEKLDFEQLCNSIDGEVFWLNLYIDYHNYKLLDGILNYKTKSKISFISLILDSSFKNSNLFKDNYEKRLNSLDNDIYIY
ncbi:MAG: hypothetical protein PUB96_05690, partial [Helicobacteraceae bacterium]|nr:hypothetical protein [Helicobacteraceae bacterium]